MRVAGFACSGAVAVVLWLVAIWVHFRGGIPTWSLFVLAPSLMALLVLHARWIHRRTREEIEAADELRPWRSLRVVRCLQLAAESIESTTLILELASDTDPTTTAATLRFKGVARLGVAQYASYPIFIDGLRSRRLRRPRADGCVLAVRDVYNSMLAFECVAFEGLPPYEVQPRSEGSVSTAEARSS